MNVPWLLLPALLLEAVFYFLPAVAGFQKRFGAWPAAGQSAAIALSGIVPLAWLNLAAGSLPEAVYWATGAILLVCLWPLAVPGKPVGDLLLMALLAMFILAPWFKPAYPELAGGPRLDALAKLLWLRLGIALFLFPRRYRVPGFSLWPGGKDWWVGTREFALFFGLLMPVGLYVGFLRLQLPKVPEWQVPLVAVGTFLGIYLFVALGEEFFFRGILQPLLSKGLGSRAAGIGLSCLLFGAVHLPYRGFPNWRFALLAAVAGFFYNRAFESAGSLRAAMVAHAWVVTAWTVLFARSL